MIKLLLENYPTTNRRYYGNRNHKQIEKKKLHIDGSSYCINCTFNSDKYLIITVGKEIMSNWVLYNPNPAHNRVGDCTVRAISKALEQDWETTYAGLTAYGYILCDMPNANWVWGAYLEDKGFKQRIINKNGKRIYSVNDFCVDNPKGIYILAIDGHVVCVVDGSYYDSWDSGKEIPIFYWGK